MSAVLNGDNYIALNKNCLIGAMFSIIYKTNVLDIILYDIILSITYDYMIMQ